MKITTFNIADNTQVEREANAQELAQMELDKAEADAKKAEAQAKATQRQAILNRLGLSQEEANILLGGN